jgi:uncharacterized protein YndB with AHSA1/START domain
VSFIPGRIFRPFGQGRRLLSSTEASRTLAASPSAVWRVVEDPHQMPRWWPGVQRMEGVEADRFTQVFQTKRRRTVRADFRILGSESPGTQHTVPGRLSWAQEIAGTPFERVLHESITELVVEPVQGGTRVTLAQRQRLRGYSRTGTLVMRSATRKRLNEALDGLERILG